jgi:hypothetical protein
MTAQTHAAPAAAKKNTAPKAKAPKAAAPKIEDNRVAMHGDTHDMHDAAAHFDSEIHDEFPKDWIEPSKLEAPAPRDGFRQRWVRVEVLGKQDAQNVASQSRQGWRPRPLNSVPAAERSRFPAYRTKNFGNVIKSGDLILCEMPQGVFDQMSAFYRNKARSQVAALDQSLQAGHEKVQRSSDQDHGFHPISVTRKTEVGTRRPMVAGDED